MCNLVREVKKQNKYIISKNIEKTKIFLKNNSKLFLILRMFKNFLLNESTFIKYEVKTRINVLCILKSEKQQKPLINV
jgi:hypothetical protein